MMILILSHPITISLNQKGNHQQPPRASFSAWQHSLCSSLAWHLREAASSHTGSWCMHPKLGLHPKRPAKWRPKAPIQGLFVKNWRLSEASSSWQGYIYIFALGCFGTFFCLHQDVTSFAKNYMAQPAYIAQPGHFALIVPRRSQ